MKCAHSVTLFCSLPSLGMAALTPAGRTPVAPAPLATGSVATPLPLAAAPAVGSSDPAPLPFAAGSMPVADADQALQLGLRRVTGKQAPSREWRRATDLWKTQATVSDEVLFGELGKLAPGHRCTHVHYTHGRSGGAGHKQPCTMSREAFWKHLEDCYREAYPDPASPTGSILSFGIVAQERYSKTVSGHSDTHKHAACFCSEQHRWSRVAEVSRAKGVYVNAVAHYSYSVMYRYLRQPTVKKPIAALDAEPYLSPNHPRDGDLEALLVSSDRSAELNAKKARVRGRESRDRVPNLYALVSEKGFKTATALRAHACTEAEQGRPALAEWCTRKGEALQELLDNAWKIRNAPEQVSREQLTRLDILRAASGGSCVCSGQWPDAARTVLSNNKIAPAHFATAVRSALNFGAVRGAHVACIGRGGCGKSTLLEPLEEIFKCAEKPQMHVLLLMLSLCLLLCCNARSKS